MPANSNAPSSGVPISRRGFLIGTIGIAAAAAIGGTAVAVSQCSKSPVEANSATIDIGDLSVLNVPESSVFTTEDCEYIEDIDSVAKVSAEASLPYGTMVWADDDKLAACLLPCKTSDPLTQVGLLSLDNGEITTVLEEAIGSEKGFDVFDVRANSQGAIWTECNIVSGEWRIYTAALKGTSLQNAVLAASGNSDWKLPSIAVSGGYAFWQMIPSENGPYEDEDSLLMRVAFGGNADSVKIIYESPGKMACELTTTAQGIAIAPRAESGGKYYQLTHIAADSGQVLDELILPSSMIPTYIAYGDTGFSFAFDGIYSYGGGIADLGTYTPVDAKLTADSQWFRFPRTPLTSPAYCKDWFIVKSTSAVAGIDLGNKRYFSITPEHITQGYGEFLASSGTVGKFVTYANIDYTPVSGDHIRECKVRIWELSGTN